MKWPYLEVTFRHGRPLAAYLYLPRAPGDKSHYSDKAGAGLIIDYTETGKAIGVEITAPGILDVAELNRVLAGIQAPALTAEDIAPLRAA